MKSAFILILTLCIGCVITTHAADAAPAAVDSVMPAAPQRGAAEIQEDMKVTATKLAEVLPSPKLLGDAEFRKENATKVLPLLRKLADLQGELAATPGVEWRRGLEMQRLPMLGLAMALGDKDAEKKLRESAASKDANEALWAKSALTEGNWLLNSGDAGAQQKLLDDYAALARANPDSMLVAHTLMEMSEWGPANKEMSGKALEVMRTNMPGYVARGKELAGRAADAGNLRSVSWGCISWAQGHKNEYPDHLARLVAQGKLAPGVLVSQRLASTPELVMTDEIKQLATADFEAFARKVDEHCDFIYFGKGMDGGTAPSIAVAMEKPRSGLSEGINIAFQDGHVEFVKWPSVRDTVSRTNLYRKAHNLLEIDIDALLKSAPAQACPLRTAL
jgi:prepilin-type processing-associated H-X9-DG protein